MKSKTDETNPPTLLEDIRLIFATILTDPGSSLAYGADALVAVTIVLIAQDYSMGVMATFIGGGIIMSVYLIAILVYNSMTRHHIHRTLGGGAFVSSLLTSRQIRTPWLKKTVGFMGKTGTASLLADFPATQAISLIAGVEALYFIPQENRLAWAMVFLVFLSMVQRYGLGNLARYMIWPVLAFYISNFGIQVYGLSTILDAGWQPPTLSALYTESSAAMFWPIILAAVANGATLITGVEVGYSSVNFPYHKGQAIRISMWILYCIVLVTYSLQLINFLGMGIDQSVYDGGNIPPLPIQIAQHVGSDMIAVPFGLLTAMILLLAAQTAQSDFPLELLRASRSNFFPHGIGDSSWRKTRPTPVIGGHSGVYNPRAIILLGALSFVILVFFPHSHAIESMYGLAVVTAMCIDIASYLLRQIRLRKRHLPKAVTLTVIGLVVMAAMLFNILVNKFFEGAWFIVLFMVIYMAVFLFSEVLYELWTKKLNLVPLELGLWYPAFANYPVEKKNILLVSVFHPGVIHFLKSFVKKKKMPLVVHFQTDPQEKIPEKLPCWFKNIKVSPDTNTITAITDYIRSTKPERVHLIPLLVEGIDPIKKYYFGNSIEQLKYALSEYAELQVEYNQERIRITVGEIFKHIFPAIYRSIKKSK